MVVFCNDEEEKNDLAALRSKHKMKCSDENGECKVIGGIYHSFKIMVWFRG